MLFKKRPSVTPVWWVELDRKQKVYAHRLADWMGRRAARVPAPRLRIWVIAFLLGLAGLDLTITMFSIRDHHKAPSGFGWTAPVAVPERKLSRPPRPRQSLQAYLDSLRQDPVGAMMLDSLLKARPGLADTLRRVEGMAP